MVKKFKEIFKRKITRDQCKDAGMAFVLVFMLLNFIFYKQLLLVFALIILLISMTAPIILKPLAALWFGFAEALGTIVSKILLLVIYFTIVTPVAVLRRILKRDSLNLNNFKESQVSVMKERNITFGPEDIERPF